MRHYQNLIWFLRKTVPDDIFEPIAATLVDGRKGWSLFQSCPVAKRLGFAVEQRCRIGTVQGVIRTDGDAMYQADLPRILYATL